MDLQIPEFLKRRGIKQIVGLDFETFFSTHYTLRKMSTSLYIYDKQFKVHGVGIDDVYLVSDIQEYLDSVDWNSTALLCHHTQFDGLILSHHYGIKPAYYMCTMSMARPWFKNSVGASLDKVAKELGHEGKTSNILERTKGKLELTYEEAKEMGEYCLQDVDQMKKVFRALVQITTEKELDLIDMTIRMYAQPKFGCDIERIKKEINTQVDKRNRLMMEARVVPLTNKTNLEAHCRLNNIPYKNETSLQLSEKILRSSDMFAKALENAGAAVPMKDSPTTGKRTYAFAKTDIPFLALSEHQNEQVRNLFHARMAAKSTTALDKAEKLYEMSKYGPIPVYLNYWPTQTGRWSGGDKIQLQNMPRGGEMRKSLLAPDIDTLLTVIDSSGIEMRTLAWLSNNEKTLKLIREGKDVYKDMASSIYEVPYNKVTKQQRFIGKIAILGLGYGMSAKKFKLVLESGAMGPPMEITEDDAEKVVNKYRTVNKCVADLWDRATKEWLEALNTTNGTTDKTGTKPYIEYEYKGIKFERGKVTLPDKTVLVYPNLRTENGGITYDGPNNQRKYIYGALLVENLVQALSRSILAEQVLAGSRLYPCLLMVHDEGVYAVPRFRYWKHEKELYRIFTTNPEWCPDLPLDAEYGTAREYSK